MIIFCFPRIFLYVRELRGWTQVLPVEEPGQHCLGLTLSQTAGQPSTFKKYTREDRIRNMVILKCTIKTEQITLIILFSTFQ